MRHQVRWVGRIFGVPQAVEKHTDYCVLSRNSYYCTHAEHCASHHTLNARECAEMQRRRAGACIFCELASSDLCVPLLSVSVVRGHNAASSGNARSAILPSFLAHSFSHSCISLVRPLLLLLSFLLLTPRRNQTIGRSPGLTQNEEVVLRGTMWCCVIVTCGLIVSRRGAVNQGLGRVAASVRALSTRLRSGLLRQSVKSGGKACCRLYRDLLSGTRLAPSPTSWLVVSVAHFSLGA